LTISANFHRSLWTREGRHGRNASIYSIAFDFPKLDVAGSIPVSRSYNQEVASLQFSLHIPFIPLRKSLAALSGWLPFWIASVERQHKVSISVSSPFEDRVCLH
jgi:hypothetical protein